MVTNKESVKKNEKRSFYFNFCIDSFAVFM